ncbi:hypothetical protein ACET3Z_017103 [Daucus carota]
MASKAMAKPMLRGVVKAVPSGDTMVIMEMGNKAPEIPVERTVILSSLTAPRLARRGRQQTTDEPFSWQSREFLRKLCIGKEVGFQIDYTLPRKGLEFGTVFLGDKNVACWVVAQGWAKVREARESEKDKGECSPHLKMLRNCENMAINQGFGLWSKAAGAVRDLPPSAVDDPDNLDAEAFLDGNKGRPVEAIVEYVPNGSTLLVYLLPDYEHVRVFVAGVQAPLLRNRNAEPEKADGYGKTSNGTANGKTPNGTRGPLKSAQNVATSSAPVTKDAPDTYGRESKHFTELRVLHRNVRIVFEDYDRTALIGSVYYQDGELIKDLAVQLLENGLAKYVEWSASFLQDKVRLQLKNSELAAKNNRLRMWNNYMPPPTTSQAIKDQNFTGKVVEVASGDCIVVKVDSLPVTSSAAGRRVYLSSIRCPRLVNGRNEDRGKVSFYAREAREFLKKHLYGRQVHVSMEYSRKVNTAEGPEERVMEFGSVFLESQSESTEDVLLALPTAGSQHHRTNIAELMVARGFAEVIRHREFEVRSNYYDALVDAECRAKVAKEGMHSDKKYGEKQAIRESSVNGQEVSSTQAIKRTPKEEFQVVVKEVLGGGRFYVQTAADQKEASIIQQKLASLKLREAPAIGSFKYNKGDLVIAQFSQDNCWYRAMIAKYEVFYIDYGTQEFVAYSRLRPTDCYSVPSSPGLAQLCSLAHVKVPSWEEDHGKEAAHCLSDHILNRQQLKAIVEERDTSGGEARGHGTGTNLIVTLMDAKANISINAVMLKKGYARVDKTRREDAAAEQTTEEVKPCREDAAVKQTIKKLEAYQVKAKKERIGMWENGDIISDDDDENEKSSC